MEGFALICHGDKGAEFKGEALDLLICLLSDWSRRENVDI